MDPIPHIRCPHQPTAIRIYQAIQQIKQEGDSLGGIIQGCVYGLPVGLGEPVFDKIQALMAHAMLSIPATKGF
jgi:chorismate synthase